MAYKIAVQKDLCISSGKCVSDGPNVFRFDDQELAEPIEQTTEYELQKLLKIARNCPGEAIAIFSEEGNVIDHS